MLRQLRRPLGPSPEERLKLFHTDVDDEDEDSSYAKISYEQVLDIDIYFDFEEFLMVAATDQDESSPKDSKDVQGVFQVELEHIHNKMIFDSFNEALDLFRVYGARGAPLGFKPQTTPVMAISDEKLPSVLLKAAQRVIEWSTFMCGFIPYKEDSFIQVPRNLDEDTFQQIKEDRLIRLLGDEVGCSHQVYSSEDKWQTHEDEMVEVQIELSDMVFEYLIADAVCSLLKINQQNQVFMELLARPPTAAFHSTLTYDSV